MKQATWFALLSSRGEVAGYKQYPADASPDNPGTLYSAEGRVLASAPEAWSYQTGDNSYTGGAYGHPFWGVVSLYRRSNSAALADDIREQLADGSAYWRGEHAAAKA